MTQETGGFLTDSSDDSDWDDQKQKGRDRSKPQNKEERMAWRGSIKYYDRNKEKAYTKGARAKLRNICTEYAALVRKASVQITEHKQNLVVFNGEKVDLNQKVVDLEAQLRKAKGNVAAKGVAIVKEEKALKQQRSIEWNAQNDLDEANKAEQLKGDEAWAEQVAVKEIYKRNKRKGTNLHKSKVYAK